jgi:1,4-alpha-glucan branching enzyme
MQTTGVQHSLEGDPQAVQRLVRAETSDPHALLGVHRLQWQGAEGLVVRAFAPAARGARLHVVGSEPQPMQQVHDGGLFACFLPDATLPLRYEIAWELADGSTPPGADPYGFASTLGELDLHLFGEGTHYRLYERLGAHPRSIDGVAGTSFAVWAPNAVRVSVVGTFNGWDGRRHPMRRLGASGVWELFLPGVGVGELYKYELKLRDGQLRLKTDPMAFAMELRPKSASVVQGLGNFAWHDEDWIRARAVGDPRQKPMAIYEVHLGSWMRASEGDGGWLSYRELAPRLIEHCKAHGFTHLELLPIAEHAFDLSWGYQTTGYFAPTARYGAPDDLRYFIDLCHQHGLGVLLDWVPAHFPKDDYALRWFDGTALYEHADPREGEHRDWGTLIFNYGRHEVRAFLLANALYWLDQFHFDGLRVDAVASMIYRDYSRPHGEWIPNQYGGRENLEAIALLQELNRQVYSAFPGVLTIAEESTAWGGVTAPTYLGGLGFGFKWNMGWMHDTLHYFTKDPVHRKYHHNDLTFSMLYAWTENFILPLSHDEVVHGKRALLSKMPGDDWRKAAGLRQLLAYLYAHPGKKLLFMGAEFGQWSEWRHDASLDWQLLAEPRHSGIQRLVQQLGQLYLGHDALWAWDHEPRGFQWIDCTDSEQSVISFLRRGPQGELVCVFNLTPLPRRNYRIGVPAPGDYLELVNSDAEGFGGSNLGNCGRVVSQPIPSHGMEQSLALTLPPLGALIFTREATRPTGDAVSVPESVAGEPEPQP